MFGGDAVVISFLICPRVVALLCFSESPCAKATWKGKDTRALVVTGGMFFFASPAICSTCANAPRSSSCTSSACSLRPWCCSADSADSGIHRISRGTLHCSQQWLLKDDADAVDASSSSPTDSRNETTTLVCVSRFPFVFESSHAASSTSRSSTTRLTDGSPTVTYVMSNNSHSLSTGNTTPSALVNKTVCTNARTHSVAWNASHRSGGRLWISQFITRWPASLVFA
mmetsp:Transcript_14877/g.49094  ORF Transcript_14877/g.49094 Transcript_14877/m.49094 type:complete len:227 (-) Transcript_14877:106-786(-)